MNGPLTLKDYAGLAILMMVSQILWGLATPQIHDWDAQYYLAVARHLAAGEPAQTLGVWSLALTPPSLPAPADWHWMWLPSKILVPGLWLSADYGHVLVNSLLASCLPVFAAAFAVHLGMNRRWALGAGLLAIAGGVYQPLWVAPDGYALFGAIGAAGTWALLRSRFGLVAVMALLAGLTRSDGFLLAGLFALFAASWWRPVVAASGIVGTGAWLLSNHLQFGEAFWTARQQAVWTREYSQWFAGIEQGPLSLAERFGLFGAELGGLGMMWLSVGMMSLTAFAFWAAWTSRRETLGRLWIGGVIALPLLSLLLAPVIVGHGSLFRFHSAFFALDCGLIVMGLCRFVHWAEEARGYHPAFFLILLGGLSVAGSLGKGVERLTEPTYSDCEPLRSLALDEPVFSAWVLDLEIRCGRTGVFLSDEVSPERAKALAKTYGIRYAVVSTEEEAGALTLEGARQVLEGWTLQGERLLVAPEDY